MKLNVLFFVIKISGEFTRERERTNKMYYNQIFIDKRKELPAYICEGKGGYKILYENCY